MGLREEIAAWAAAEELWLGARARLAEEHGDPGAANALLDAASAIGRLAWRINPSGRGEPPAPQHPVESPEVVSTAMAYVAQAGKCPDGGTCHHGCWSTRQEEAPVHERRKPCFRVLGCGPLSGVFPGDAWPTRVVHAERQAAGREQDRENVENLERAAAALRVAAAATAPGETTDPDIEITVRVGGMQVYQQIQRGIPADVRVTVVP